MRIRVIDFETTGLPEEPDAEICEVGLCDIERADGAIRVYDPISWLCKPSKPIRPEIRAIHHITERELEGAPLVPAALDELTTRPGPIDYFAAHNVTFEKAFFRGGETPWLCTYRIALRVWPEGPASYSNQVLRYWLGLDLDERAMPPHRAGPDAYVTAHVLARLLPLASIEDMVRWSSGPPLLTVVTFGKHKGSKWKDLPGDYLDWIANKSDMDSDTKANARFQLKQRRSAA